jgi:nucleotide-binding universal stress UspA family protein
MFKKILVPTDGSPLSDKAVAAAIAFAREYGAQIVGLSVAEPYPFAPLAESAFTDERAVYEQRARELAQERVGRIASAAEAVHVPCTTAVAQSFSPHDEIVKAAVEHGCDLIFMASHGRKGLSRLLIGSETQRVLANSTIPVLVYR